MEPEQLRDWLKGPAGLARSFLLHQTVHSFVHLFICSLQHLSSCLMGSFLSQILAPHILISLLTL